MTGEGGTLCLVNGTTHTWRLIHHHSYQMTWNFPTTLPPGGIVRQYVEWTTGTKDWFDDGGEARYQLDGTDVIFEIQARCGRAKDGSWDHHLQVYLTNMNTSNHPVGSTIPLGWKHDGQINFIVAGTAPANLMTSQPASNWMQVNLNILGDRTLRRLCIPASHDAGMSTLTSHTTDSNINNTLTQYLSIGDQLAAGSRWFDIRPVLKGNDYYTGHYSDIGQVARGINIGWQGGTGQSISEIIDQLNAFTANNKELVIFNLSHAYDSNNGFVDISSAQWLNLCALMTRINYRYVAPGDPTTVDLTTVPLRQFISGNHAAVLLIVALDIDLGDYANQGFYYHRQFPFTTAAISKNNYKDALNSMSNYRPSADAPCFQLGWEVMQGTADAIGLGDTIRDLDEAAMPHLFTDVLPACTSESYPNQLYTDIFNGDVTVLSMAVNTLFGGN